MVRFARGWPALPGKQKFSRPDKVIPCAPAVDPNLATKVSGVFCLGDGDDNERGRQGMARPRSLKTLTPGRKTPSPARERVGGGVVSWLTPSPALSPKKGGGKSCP